MERTLDLAIAREDVRGFERALIGLAGETAQRVPVLEKFAVEGPFPFGGTPFRGNKAGVVALVKQVMNAFFVDPQVFFAAIRRRDKTGV